MDQGPGFETIMHIGFGFWASKTLFSAVELGVFTELANGPLACEALSDRIGLHPRGARDFLDALTAMGLLARDGHMYSNTAESDFYLDRSKPSYIGGVIEMANRRSYPFWASLTDALGTGRPQNEVKEGGAADVYELYKDAEWSRIFLQAMTGLSVKTAQAIAQRFPWTDHRTFIDIGTAQGELPIRIASAHSHLRGGGFDLPAVAPFFTEYVNSSGLGDRLLFYPGDFHSDPLPQADVLVMGHILHNEDLDGKLMLLRKAFEAVQSGGSLIIYDMMLDDDRAANLLGLLSSLNMLIETPGGFEYTCDQCSQWMRDAGFHDVRVEHLLGPESMAVGKK